MDDLFAAIVWFPPISLLIIALLLPFWRRFKANQERKRSKRVQRANALSGR